MADVAPRPKELTAEDLIKRAGKPIFFIGKDYNDSVNIVEWRVIDHIIIRKNGMFLYFTDSHNEYNVNSFKAYQEETYPIDEDFFDYEDPDYAELVTRIRNKYRSDKA